jgi:hypothetical protein
LNPDFLITADDVSTLTPISLPKLLGLLLARETKSANFKSGLTHVNPNIYVRDRGIDGIIDWETTPQDTRFIAHSKVIFQSKATKTAPTEIKLKGELLGEGDLLKPAILNKLNAGFHYCYFSKASATVERLEEYAILMARIANEGGFDRLAPELFHFLDSEQISQWCNKFPDIALWLRKKNHKAVITGYQTFDEMIGYEGNTSEFVSNDILTKHISEAAAVLMENKTTVRITGASGLGKTRIALESLRPFAEDAQKHPQASCICFKMQDKSTLPQLVDFIRDTRSNTEHRVILCNRSASSVSCLSPDFVASYVCGADDGT